jgi:hypothetical protein
MANITKNLNIESKDHLYKLIDSNEQLSSDKVFTIFMDRMYSLHYGCNCNYEIYTTEANKEYTNLSNNEEATSKLKEFFNCDGIVFN